MLLNLHALRLSKRVVWYQWRISEVFVQDDKFSSEDGEVLTDILVCKTSKIKFLKRVATFAMHLLLV